jgi:hypothetical protein
MLIGRILLPKNLQLSAVECAPAVASSSGIAAGWVFSAALVV